MEKTDMYERGSKPYCMDHNTLEMFAFIVSNGSFFYGHGGQQVKERVWEMSDASESWEELAGFMRDYFTSKCGDRHAKYLAKGADFLELAKYFYIKEGM